MRPEIFSGCRKVSPSAKGSLKAMPRVLPNANAAMVSGCLTRYLT
nr:hypothetical protein [uncultured Kingella sp.]